MRTILAAILLAALIVTGVAIVAPLFARPIVVSAIRDASPFGDQGLDIDVDLNVFGLLTGTLDRVHVRGSALERGGATIGALDVTATDVATSGRAFGNVAGTLATVTIPLDGGGSLTVDDVVLAGSSGDTSAVATLGSAAAARLIESAFADAGIEVSGVRLGSGTVAFEAFGVRVEVPVGVEDSAIVVVDPFGTGSLEVVRPGEDAGWRFTGASVTPGGMTIDATVNVERLLASS